MSRWVLGAGLTGMLAAATAHRALRAGPTPDRDAPALAPAPALASVLAGGRDTAAASVLWMAVTVRFSEVDDLDARTATWIHQATRTCIVLDPHWKTPARYGALMLAALGDVDAHEDVLALATSTWPDDPWFPAALGMSRLLRRGDRAGAAEWLEWAGAIEGSSSIHARAAERLRAGSPP